MNDSDLQDMLAQRAEERRAAAHRLQQDSKSLDLASSRKLSESVEPPPKSGPRRRRRWFQQQRQERF